MVTMSLADSEDISDGLFLEGDEVIGRSKWR